MICIIKYNEINFQIELENLNNATDDINKLETELDVRNNLICKKYIYEENISNLNINLQ